MTRPRLQRTDTVWQAKFQLPIAEQNFFFLLLNVVVFILTHGMTVTSTNYTHMSDVGRTFTG